MISTAFIICIVISVICAVFCRFFLGVTRRGDFRAAFGFKGAAGLCFVLVGLFMALRGPSPYAWKVFAGLALGLVGDQLLALRFLQPKRETALFMAGAITFALGHVLYIWALVSRGGGILVKGLLIALLGMAASLLYNRKKKTDPGELKGAAAGYICLVVVMAATACATAWAMPSVGAVLFALGGIGFVVSDNILVAYNFGTDKRFTMDVLVHISYYAAQLCIAWSLAF